MSSVILVKKKHPKVLFVWLPATVTIRLLWFWRPAFCQLELAGNCLEPAAGIEPATQRWQRRMLPLAPCRHYVS